VKNLVKDIAVCDDKSTVEFRVKPVKRFGGYMKKTFLLASLMILGVACQSTPSYKRVAYNPFEKMDVTRMPASNPADLVKLGKSLVSTVAKDSKMAASEVDNLIMMAAKSSGLIKSTEKATAFSKFMESADTPFYQKQILWRAIKDGTLDDAVKAMKGAKALSFKAAHTAVTKEYGDMLTSTGMLRQPEVTAKIVKAGATEGAYASASRLGTKADEALASLKLAKDDAHARELMLFARDIKKTMSASEAEAFFVRRIEYFKQTGIDYMGPKFCENISAEAQKNMSEIMRVMSEEVRRSGVPATVAEHQVLYAKAQAQVLDHSPQRSIATMEAFTKKGGACYRTFSVKWMTPAVKWMIGGTVAAGAAATGYFVIKDDMDEEVEEYTE